MDEKSVKKIKRKSFFSGVIAALLAIALLYFIYMIFPFSGGASRPDTIQTIRKAKEIQRIIDRHYLGEINEQDETDTMFVGQVAGLGDPYSRYYTKEEYEKVLKERKGTYTGIGVTITENTEENMVEVVSVQEDGPADKAGVQKGDLILKVNGQDVTGKSTSEVSDLIEECVGKEISIDLKRGASGETVSVKVTPGKLETETVKSSMLDSTTGYIQITEFAQVTVDQFKEAKEQLESQGMQKMILDLRDNGGGLVSSACDIGRQILPQGIIVYEEDKNGNRTYEKNEEDNGFSMPLVVLINENTASAAEILAGAIKDDGIGTLVGTTTYGKGIVQNDYRLSDGSVLKLTVKHYYTPDGNDIHKKGIEPDYEVEAADDGSDPQLEKAKELLAG
ncbi:MAG: S41 family peptidase [Bilifractor sp.]|jgi:carboxyl-terminal processing protease